MDYFKEQIQNISIIFYLAKINLIKTYRGSFLGGFWAFLRPIFTILVYYFTFTIGLRSSKEMFGYSYFLWLIAGIIPWFYIKDILLLGSESIRKYDYLVTKVKYPVSTIPTFSTLSAFFVHLILTGIMILIFAFSHYPLTIYLLQLPIYLFLMLVFFHFLCLLLASLSAISKDFFNFVKSFSFAIFWLSGIIWDIDLVDIPLLQKILSLNPVTFLVNGYRNCFIKQIWFWENPFTFGCFLGLTIIIMILSVSLYQKVKKHIPDLL